MPKPKREAEPDEEPEPEPDRRPHVTTTFLIAAGMCAIFLIGVGSVFAFRAFQAPDETVTPPTQPSSGGPATPLAPVPAPSSNKGKIEGTRWSNQRVILQDRRLPDGELEFEFTASGGLNYRAGLTTYRGTYSFGPGDWVTFRLNEPLAGTRTHVQKISISGTRLTMSDTDGTTIMFRKVR